MQRRNIALPELALIGATRGMLGVGIGLLVAPRIDKEHRTIAGIVLAAIGALSTIPLAFRVLRRDRVEPTAPAPV